MATEKRRWAFISYSRANQEFATKLTKGLRSAGYPVWFDQLDIPTGSRWDDEVEKALRECPIFMIILTPASIASENVKDEIGYAIDHGKRILPVLLEDCDVPLRLRRFQYVDFTEKSFEEGFEGAKELLSGLIETSSVPVPAKAPLVEASNESKPESVKAKLAAAMPGRKAATASTEASQKKQVSRGLVIGIIVILVFVIAGIGYNILFKGKTIVGQWERRSPNQTEYFNIQDDGSYSIEARNGSTNEVIASANGTITYDKNNIYLVDMNNNKTTESYYLDNEGDLLVINNQVDQAWTRSK